jgi:hypothetical protein
MASIISQAKQTVDEAVDVYFGRALVVATLLVGGAFAVAGTLIWLIYTIGAVAACFAVAALFVVMAGILRLVVAASERRAAQQLAQVEEQIADVPGNAAEYFLADPSRLLTFAPMIMPVLHFARRYLPFLLVGFFVVMAFIQRKSNRDAAEAAAATQGSGLSS